MLRIIESFYDNPDLIRESALQSEYKLISNGNYAGHDTINKMIVTDEFKTKIHNIFPENKFELKCSKFRSSLDEDNCMSYVHADRSGRGNGWHILIPLTKYPSKKDGLVLYKSKNGDTHWKSSEDQYTWDFPEWRPWKFHEYVYNQAVILDYSYFHAPLNRNGYGSNREESRLMQIAEIININQSGYDD